MRGGLALALLVLVAVTVAAGPSPTSTKWAWQSRDGRSSLSFWREGTGPLHLVAGTYAACPPGGPTGIAYLPAVLPEIRVGAGGAVDYVGPVTLQSQYTGPLSNPSIELHGRMSGLTTSGTFTLSGDLGGTAPCHAQSATIAFAARCYDGPCGRDTSALPVTVWPGVGIGGRGLGMRGVAKPGMTQAQVRALHPFAPLPGRLEPCAAGKPQRCGWIAYQYPKGGRGRYLLNPRLTTISLAGPEFKTAAGIVAGSSRRDVLRAYPGTRCRTTTGCFLLRGTTDHGVLTGFAFSGDSLFLVGLYDCTALHSFCRQVFGP
jgi:hypothetical protein